MQIKLLLLGLLLFSCKPKTEIIYAKIDLQQINQCFQIIDKPTLPSPVKTMDDVASTILLQRQYTSNLELSLQQTQQCIKNISEVFNNH